MGRGTLALWIACGSAALLVTACGSSPSSPGGVVPVDPTPVVAPPNTPPVIQSIAVQGRRTREAANFADLSETIDLTAAVQDQETPLDQLEYAWTADLGTIEGSGPKVTWRAPDAAATPLAVTVTLKVTEKYGYPGQARNYQQDVSASATVSLHNSTKEVGDMARQFLLDFSDSSVRDVEYVLRNFSAASCPDPREISSERNDVTNNRAQFRIVNSRIGAPAVTLNFGGRCQFPDPTRRKAGDACAVVPSFWDSIQLSDNTRGSVNGDDYVAAVYSGRDSRWWLCASDYDGRLGSNMRGFIR
jgi:hypothetical protein